jgi:hypothetical protein
MIDETWKMRARRALVEHGVDLSTAGRITKGVLHLRNVALGRPKLDRGPMKVPKLFQLGVRFGTGGRVEEVGCFSSWDPQTLGPLPKVRPEVIIRYRQHSDPGEAFKRQRHQHTKQASVGRSDRGELFAKELVALGEEPGVVQVVLNSDHGAFWVAQLRFYPPAVDKRPRPW